MDSFLLSFKNIFVLILYRQIKKNIKLLLKSV